MSHRRRRLGVSDEKQLAALIIAIGAINLYNRMNHAIRQEGGS